jgi:RNase P/RNase MRP subunit p30
MIKQGLELLKKYGAKDLFFVVAIVFLYNMNAKNELKIETIEAKLYDCLEDKSQINRSAKDTTKNNYPLLAILPNEKTYLRYACTKRKV